MRIIYHLTLIDADDKGYDCGNLTATNLPAAIRTARNCLRNNPGFRLAAIRNAATWNLLYNVWREENTDGSTPCCPRCGTVLLLLDRN